MKARREFFSARNVCGRRAYVCAGCRTALPKGLEHVSVSKGSATAGVSSWRYCSGCAAEAGLDVEKRGAGKASNVTTAADRTAPHEIFSDAHG